ncbi:polo-like kinase 3, partial [Mortierella sp. 14UC]
MKTGDEYEEKCLLGRGAFGRVVKVVRKSDGKIFALKAMSEKSETMANDEAAILNHLKRVEGTVTLVAKFKHRKEHCLLMEFCGWGDLETLIRIRGRLTEPEVRLICKQLVETLASIHKAKIIHLDLKPANIFIGEGMKLKVGDFGIAAKIEVKTWGVCGTPGFIAPEVLADKKHTTKADVWSLGMIALVLLTGKMPCHVKFHPSQYDSTRLSPEASDFIVKSMHRQPAIRKTAQELKSHPFLTQGQCPGSLGLKVFFLPPQGHLVMAAPLPKRPLSLTTNKKTHKKAKALHGTTESHDATP